MYEQNTLLPTTTTELPYDVRSLVGDIKGTKEDPALDLTLLYSFKVTEFMAQTITPKVARAMHGSNLNSHFD